MSKKTKAPKAANKSKVKGGVGSRDSITGLSISVDGIGVIESDKVYDLNSGLGRYIVSTFDPQYRNALRSFNAELEFGSKDFIVLTVQETSTTGGYVNRQVIKGAFEYKNNSISSARVDSMANVNANAFSSYGNIISFGGRSVPNPKSVSSWSSALGYSGSQVAYFDSYKDGSTGAVQVDGNKASVVSFEGGRFFADGWEANPFATNLI